MQELRKAVAADSERRKSFSSMEKYETLLNDPETNSELNKGGSADIIMLAMLLIDFVFGYKHPN